MTKNKVVFDNEELELLEELERGEWIDSPISKEESKTYAKMQLIQKHLMKKNKPPYVFQSLIWLL